MKIQYKYIHFAYNMNMLQVSRIVNDAKLPVRKTSGSAGYDLYSSEGGVINPKSLGIIPTGVVVKIPERCCGQIWPRSGLSVKCQIDTGAGVIDSDYMGELKIVVFNHGRKPFEYKKHTRVAQLLIIPIFTPPVVEVDTVSGENRGGGFGSTGLH